MGFDGYLRFSCISFGFAQAKFDERILFARTTLSTAHLS